MTGLSKIPYLIFQACEAVTPVSITSALEGFETGFYACLQIGQRPSLGRAYNWVRETSVTHMKALQIFFSCTSLLTCLYYTTSLFKEISLTGRTLINLSLLGVGSSALAYFFHNYNKPNIAPIQAENGREGLSFVIRLSLLQKYTTLLQIAKITLNLSLLIFTPYKIGSLINLISLTHSLWKNLQLRYFHCTATFKPTHDLIKKITFTYPLLMFHTPPTETCSICINDDSINSLPFRVTCCANHSFHHSCIWGWFAEKKPTLLDEWSRLKKHRVIRYTQYGSHVDHFYTVSKPSTTFTCPECRALPSETIQITDNDHANLPVHTTIIHQNPTPSSNYQSIFTHLKTGYTSLQGGLAFLQTYPELANQIFKIQSWLIGTDLIFLLGNAYYLHKHVTKRYNINNSFPTRILSIATFTAFVALSYFAIAQLNLYLRPALLLKDAVTPISSELLKNVSFDWVNPLSQQLLQTLFLARAISSAYLAFFSHTKLNCLNALLEVTCFAGISNLYWIQLAKPITNFATNVIKEMHVQATFMVNIDATRTLATLQETLTSTAQTMHTLFENATYSRYWYITTVNGIESSRQISYNIVLNVLKNVNPNNFLPALSILSCSIIDRFYGAARVIVSY